MARVNRKVYDRSFGIALGNCSLLNLSIQRQPAVGYKPCKVSRQATNISHREAYNGFSTN